MNGLNLQVETHAVARGPMSSYHTSMEQYNQPVEDVDLEKLRLELEQELCTWSHPQQASPEEVTKLIFTFDRNFNLNLM